MWFAKYDASTNNNQKIHGIFEFSHADDALRLPLADGEAIASISQSEADSFLQHRNANFVDGIFTASAFEHVAPERDLEDIRNFKIKELERITPAFVARKDGNIRYTLEKQFMLNAISSRCERKIKTQGTTQAEKDKLEAKIAKIESVYLWIESVWKRHYEHMNALKGAATLKDIDAIVVDYSYLNSTDPDVKLEAII